MYVYTCTEGVCAVYINMIVKSGMLLICRMASDYVPLWETVAFYSSKHVCLYVYNYTVRGAGSDG